jgi:hypothetical protein
MSKKKDAQFFESLDAVMNDMAEQASEHIHPEDVTIKRVVRAARDKGKTITSASAQRLIQLQVDAGVLKPDGKRRDPEVKKAVCVWVLVKK